MIISLSPAKLLNFDSPITTESHSQPLFKKEAKDLMTLLQDLSTQDISELMAINPKQTLDVYQQIHGFNMARAPHRQAAFAYNGIAFSGLNVYSLPEECLQFAQKHLIILSGLYGALRPLDLIKPYRLEMQAKLTNEKGKDLYAFWSDIITPYFVECLKKNQCIWINLSSNEYSKVINKKMLPKNTRIITPLFKEQQANGSYKQIVVYAKKARGMMAHYIIRNQIKDLELVKGFDEEGYTFSPNLSGESEWVFVR